MGVLVPNQRRRVNLTVLGQKKQVMQSCTILDGGIITHVTAGKEEGSRIDGSEYATAFAQVEPGTVARITGYGPEKSEQLLNLKPGDKIAAYLTPITRFGLGFKLADIVSVQGGEPQPDPAPASAAA